MSSTEHGDRQLIELRDVFKSFGKNQVLKGVDLTVRAHSVVGLIGPSGSGKSTLLRCINLLEPVDSGSVFVGGVELTAGGVDADCLALPSPQGHDAFLVDIERFGPAVAGFLSKL